MEDSMTVSADGYNLQVFRDEYAESPREWDNLGKMVAGIGAITSVTNMIMNRRRIFTKAMNTKMRL